MLKREFQVSGMTCAACQARVTRVVSVLLGVSDVDVNLLTGKMTVVFDETKIDEKAIEDAVSKAGYHAEVSSDDDYDEYSAKWKKLKQMQRKDIQTMKVRLIVSISILLPLLYISMGSMMGLPTFWFFDGMQNAVWLALVQLIFTSIIIVVNRKFFISGFKALVSLSPNMDSLVAIGAVAAYIYGIAVTIMLAASKVNMNMELTHKLMHNLYFESAATILTLVTLGKFFETLSKNKTTSALENLVKMSPKTATILKDGKEIVVPAKNIQKGDIVVIKTGDIVAVDGKIVQGEGLVNQASITGESVPVKKVNGDVVISASICENGSFQMVATKVGKETTFAQIIELVDEASSSKAPISKVADRVSGVFVPIVIGLAIITFLIWIIISKNVGTSLSNAISVLVISCPCALGLATPVAIMVGTGRASNFGVLIKSAEKLELLQKATTVVFDKTGTLTIGKPVLTDIEIFDETFDENKIKQIIASLEVGSNHATAFALKNGFNEKNLKKVESFKEVSGSGVQGKIDGKMYFVGNFAYADKNVKAKDDEGNKNIAKNSLEQFSSLGKTSVLMFDETHVIAALAVADVIREDAKVAIQNLKRLGLRVVMLTGDNKTTAKFVQNELEIDECIAEVLPADKDKKIMMLCERGEVVVMVGDGINDSPALSRADIGMAISTGTDIALDSADIVLTRNSIESVVSAYLLSRAVMNNIKINLFWAFFYNAVSIPIAMGVLAPIGVFLSPMIASLAMSFSSVCVCLNALGLRFFDPVRKMQKISKNNKNSLKLQQNKLKNAKKVKKEKIMKVKIVVGGMVCEHCQNHVKNALLNVKGVNNVSVNLNSGEVEVEAQEGLDLNLLSKAIEDEGYRVLKMN